MNRYFYTTFILLLTFGCSSDNKENTNDSTENVSPNILLIIADDLGKDAIKGYTEGSIKPNTPNLDAIRTSGLTFTNFWASPLCTPTRSCVITGKYGFHSGVKSVADVLNPSEVVLQKYINNNTNNKYASAVVGKWHLVGNLSNFNPETFGIDYYAGLIKGAVDDYYQWPLTADGTTSLQTKYITEVFTDLSIDWIKAQSKPWFLWLAYNAPHAPFHVPPTAMHSQGNLPAYSTGMDAKPYYMAAIEAMDYQIGKLLSSIPENIRKNTLIIFIGDNGTPNQVAQSPYTSTTVKNTLYQGGINVPMFVSGSGVLLNGTDQNLITATDIFATIGEIAGVSATEYQDSKSFKSLLSKSSTIRKYQYSDVNDGTTDSWAISDGTYKLLVKGTSSSKELYNLTTDPYEKSNLLIRTLTIAEETARLELEAELGNIRK